jgi:hypothetical protein
MASAHIENSAHSTGYEAQRLHTNDMEIGVTDAVQRHIQRHVVAPKPVSQRKLDFEHSRPRWMREMAAEALGVFFYVYVPNFGTSKRRQSSTSKLTPVVIPVLPRKHRFS